MGGAGFSPRCVLWGGVWVFDLGVEVKLEQEYAFSNWESGATTYIGYETKDGAWLIQKIVLATGAVTFARGEHDYTTNWIGRAALTYGAFSGAY